MDTFLSCSDHNAFQIYLESNIKHLFISLYINNSYQTFKGCFTKEDLINLDNNFNNFTSIEEIHKLLLKYLETSNNTIYTKTNNTSIELKCTELFKGSEINFILNKSNHNSMNFYLKENKITFISNSASFSKNKNPFEISNNSNVTTNEYIKKDISINQLFYLFHYFCSFLLIITLLILCGRYILFTNFLSFSSIATNDDFSMISEWIHPKFLFKYTLLYKATRDGDSSQIFHQLCDQKGPTLTLISTQAGWKFGGYTDSSWRSDEDPGTWSFQTGNNIFLFSLNLKKKYPSFNKTPGIFCAGSKGPTFGHGFDISVSHKCLHEQSACNSPSSFMNLATANEFNGNEVKFLAKEIEIYQIEERGFKK